MSASERRLFDLLDFVLDGSSSDAELEEFARLVEAHPEWTRDLAEEVFVHSLLQWQSEDVGFDLAYFGLPDSAREDAVLAGSAAQSAHSPFTILRPWLVAAAAVGLVVSALMTWRAVPPGRANRLAVARIVEQDGVSWSPNSTALESDGSVFPGRLESNSGAFTLQFHTGPTVRISGPASLMIESDMLVHLDRGQATARVPEPRKGFTFRTPVVDVIDQGTEFGVIARDSGVTDIVVFDGKVDLADSISSQGAPTRLVRGEAARVDRRGGIERIMQVGRDRKGQWWTKDDPAREGSLIRSVHDNIPAVEGTNYFCFQITNDGLADDAFAYADHPHQWNGLTSAGLPEFLRGAEYVQTFNDYRYVRHFKMVVELAQPADLYVFFDDRVPIPAWLADQFVDTGVDIGLDEGPWEGIEDHAVAVGGGESIDNVFSVWHRRCDAASPIVLGPMSPTSEARAMYGFAVTPPGRAESPRVERE